MECDLQFQVFVPLQYSIFSVLNVQNYSSSCLAVTQLEELGNPVVSELYQSVFKAPSKHAFYIQGNELIRAGRADTSIVVPVLVE